MKIEYKGYVAQIDFAPSPGVYVGELKGLPDIVSFSALDLETIKQLMMEAVDDYLECFIQSIPH